MQSPDVSIKSIAWSPGGADNGEIRDGLSDQTIRVMDDYSHDGPFGAEGWSPDGKEIISVDLSDLVIWDVDTGATIWKTPFDGNGNIFISWSPDGRLPANDEPRRGVDHDADYTGCATRDRRGCH